MRVALSIGLLAALLYGSYAVAMVLMHSRFIYPFSDAPFALEGFETRSVTGSDGADVTVYLHDAGEGRPVVLYFMGNAGAAILFERMLAYHRDQGRSVAVLGYRGGGGLPGTPSEAVLKSDAVALYEALPDLLPGDRGMRVAHGYSLGTGVALHVAANRPLDGVILSAPYAKLCRLMAQAAWLPACLLPGVQHWNSEALVGEIKAPVLVLHGSDDTLVPYTEGARLISALEAAGAPVERVMIPGGGHTDLMDFGEYLNQVDGFFAPPA